MKLHCHRPSLAAAFQTVSGVVPTRTPKEILKNVKIQAAGGKVTLIGTDQEVGIRYEVPGIEVGVGGETLVPTSRIISILRELQDESVDLEVAGDAVWVRSGHSEFRLSAIDPAEFPPVAAFEEKAYHAITGRALRAAIRRTIFATDVESTRYALGGVLVELATDKIACVATDSRRLALMETVCRTEGNVKIENAAPVIPSKAMTLIERSIADDEAEVHLAAHTNHVLVRSGNSTIYSRLVEGRFPRYRDVIPKDATVTVDMVVGPFYSAVRQAQIVTDEESRGVDFAFADGMLTMKSQAADIGASTVQLPISYTAEPITITFDPRFIADFLKVLEPEKTIQVRLIDGDSAAVLRAEENYTYVIMPLSRDR
ncbi:MAG: DNA polymerase III subunit beta [Planctomycetaceae bacterium]|nr:DNA polymerase III subunit beta [Planctomycetaceae bacterium]